jgi:uncharacterized protein (DUF1800 family)
MQDFFNKSISRRDFLRLNLAAMTTMVAFRPFSGLLEPQIGETTKQIGGSGLNSLITASQTGLTGGRPYSPLTLLAANRLTFGARQTDLDWIETNGVDAFIDEQLAFEKIDDSALTSRLQGLTTLNQPAGSPFPANAADALQQLQQATFLRAVYSKRQLYELMVDFWSNHFYINFNTISDFILKTVDDREVTRKNALGNFRDLLGASAHSPAMLSFNVYSDLKQDLSPNEYYARELLELQTVGLNGSYTEKDVTEITRAFTGWTVSNQDNNGKPIVGVFNFLVTPHDWGVKYILGHKLPGGGGVNEGDQVLDILAALPACAEYISSKLVQRFISDNPPASVIQVGANTFQSSHGDIRATLGAILHSPEFKTSFGLKTKRPFEFMVSALRIMNAETDAGSSLLSYLQKMGQPLFLSDDPGGFPDTADAWMNAGDMVARWNFAKAIANNSITGTNIDLTPLSSRPDNIVAIIAQAVLGRALPTELITALQPIADPKKIPELVALLIGSPLFQLRS